MVTRLKGLIINDRFEYHFYGALYSLDNSAHFRLYLSYSKGTVTS